MASKLSSTSGLKRQIETNNNNKIDLIINKTDRNVITKCISIRPSKT